MHSLICSPKKFSIFFKFSFGLENIKHIPIDKYVKDFTFIVDGKRYETSRFLADLLSPTISELHSLDETADTFTITTTKYHNQQHKQAQNSNNKVDYFTDFLNIPHFDEQEIDDARQKFYSEYFIQLGNFDEYIKLQQEYYNQITTENVLDRLKHIEDIFNQTKTKSNIYENIVSEFVTFASKHFNEIEEEKLIKLSIEQIESILDRKELKIEDEDSLLKLVLRLYQKDPKYSSQFKYVYFENVEEDTLEHDDRYMEFNHLSSNQES